MMNVLFNLGYISLDYYWLIELKSTEPAYFYRKGFVVGDLYTRFYYRTLYEVNVK